MRSKLGMATAVGVLAISALSTGTAMAAPSPQGVSCDAYTSYSITQTGTAWYAFDSGTLANKSKGTISKSYAHSSSKSFTSTKSAEVQVSVSYLVASVNAKYGVSSSVTAAYTTTTTFTVTAPPNTTVSYKDGILKRYLSVVTTDHYTNCTSSSSTGTATVADNYSTAS